MGIQAYREMALELSDLIGTRYEILNCFELIVEIYRRYGIELSLKMESLPYFFYKTDDLKPLDLLAFQVIPKFTNHVGIYLGYGRFMHSVANSGVICEYLYNWKLKHVGSYRYRGQNE